MEWLAQTQQIEDTSAWVAYIKGMRNIVSDSWDAALLAYRTHKQVRETLDLPNVVQPGEAGVRGALTPTEEQEFLEVGALVQTLVQIADDALANKRRVFYVESLNDLAFEQVQGDTSRVESRGGRLVVVDPATGVPIPVSGTLGLPPIAWAGIAGAAVAALGIQYFIAKEVCEAAQTLAEQRTMQTVVEKQAEMVASGKATPEEAKRMTDAVFQGAKELEQAKTVGKETEGETISTIERGVKLAVWGAVGLGVIYLLVRVVPPIIEAERS